MPLNGNFPSLYPILDSGFLAGADDRPGLLRRIVRELAEAGVRLLQYRNKSGNEAEILSDAHAIRAAAASGMLLILNDWPKLLAATRFDGVHIGQTDVSPAEARAILGPEKILGLSTHNEPQLQSANAEPVDYIAIGPVCATSTKENPDPVVGLEGVRLARKLTPKPLVAIGGITLENAAQIRAAGADSVAVISAIFSPKGNFAEIAADFLRAIHSYD